VVFSPEGKTFFSKDMQSAADEWLGPKDERTYVSSSLKKLKVRCVCAGPGAWKVSTRQLPALEEG
jgi:hypothetical protein